MEAETLDVVPGFLRPSALTPGEHQPGLLLWGDTPQDVPGPWFRCSRNLLILPGGGGLTAIQPGSDDEQGTVPESP